MFCSFCGKSQHDIKKLIAGPGIFICNECVTLCGRIVAESPEPDPQARIEWPGTVETAQLLSYLGAADSVLQRNPRPGYRTPVDILRKREVSWARHRRRPQSPRARPPWERFFLRLQEHLVRRNVSAMPVAHSDAAICRRIR